MFPLFEVCNKNVIIVPHIHIKQNRLPYIPYGSRSISAESYALFSTIFRLAGGIEAI